MKPHHDNNSVKFCVGCILAPMETDGNSQHEGFNHFERYLANLTFNGSVFRAICRGNSQVAAHFAVVVAVAF